ncbi:leukocyte elastase inhibitor-like [Xyrichtys novacula]|uniref:Serpin B6 n=1 Tax=Xyrichtys novacula TaxID=13765 RepID=A0AAV1H788_XYRNO|nr:leukocyte elastase inhibitor-like [Xyrichtys novacula]
MASPSTSLAKANSIFHLALFKQLSEDDQKANVFFSPFSISSALAMVMLGARGNTAAQMLEVLGFNERDQPKKTEEEEQMQMQMQSQQTGGVKDVHAEFGNLLTLLNDPSALYSLVTANRLYGEQSFKFHESFLADIKAHYSAELESEDFKTKAEEARININTWVKEKTQGKISDLLSQGAINELTKLVLVNAIYFKGTWEQIFDKELTIDHPFRISKSDTKTVKMMCMEKSFFYNSIPELNIKILEVPYKGRELSMLIFLPDDIEDDTTGLEKLQKELTYQNFEQWTEKMNHGQVEVKFPRFKLEETYSMVETLKKLGMTDLFSSLRSDFSGMSPVKGLAVSEVVHKAFVDVNEEGTEAAAATGITMETLMGYIGKPFSFVADHPFLFFIKHKPSNTVLFAGRYCKPE